MLSRRLPCRRVTLGVMSEFSLPRHDAKTLIIMRHAEADWGLDDFNRPLTRRGHAQASSAGRWLVQQGFVPEMLVSSAALRTRQTTTWVSEIGRAHV